MKRPARLLIACSLVAAGVSIVATAGLAIDAPPALAASARDNVKPCADGQEPGPGERCTGPVDNTSGGGGGALTIVVSVVIGLAIAGVAFVVLRRQLASMNRPPADARPSPAPNPEAGPGASP